MNKKRDYFLIILMIISLLNFFVMLVFGVSSNVRYFILVLNLIVVISCRENEILPLIFYTRSNFGLYDLIGFKYIFNFAIVISAIKLLVFCGKQKTVDKRSFVLIVLVFLYNAVISLLNNISFSYLLTYISLFFSYVILIIYSKDQQVDFTRIFKFYAFGMFMGVMCGALIPLSQYGLNIPYGYRFAALMRDPNGFSLDILFLVIGFFVYSKLNKNNYYIPILIFLVFGFCGLSKMYLICVVLLVFYFIIVFINNIKTRSVNYKNFFFVLLLFVLIVFLNNKFNFFDTFVNGYLDRFNITDLTSGRNDIANYYLKKIFSDPVTLLFGRGFEYYLIIGYDGWMMAHNTWLEIILSFGILGSVFYFSFIISILKNCKCKHKIYTKSELFLLILIFVFCLNALPILSGDTLAILILYIILIKNIDYNNTLRKKDSADEKN